MDAEFELTPSRVLVPSSTGSGAQFNQHVYAAISGVPLERFSDLEQKVLRLKPQFVRLFYNDRQETASRDQLESFLLAADLAQRAGATINVTWQSGGVATPDRSMGRFAALLAYLRTSRGLENLRWATIQNEPNSTRITPEQNGTMYRALDRHLAAAGVREQIRFMGGDLVQDNQRVWFRYMASHLADLLDAYSVHIYWDYWDVAKFRRRLTEVQEIVGALPQSGRKPVFVTEYGVRGRRAANVPAPGTFADGTPIAQTTIAAFQQAWFQILATQLGYAGTVKWDCYYGRYDRRTQAHYAIGPWQDGWPLYPTYFALRLVTETTAPGWKAVALQRRQRSARTKHLAALAGPSGELTILGLDGAAARGFRAHNEARLPPLNSGRVSVRDEREQSHPGRDRGHRPTPPDHASDEAANLLHLGSSQDAGCSGRRLPSSAIDRSVSCARRRSPPGGSRSHRATASTPPRRCVRCSRARCSGG